MRQRRLLIALAAAGLVAAAGSVVSFAADAKHLAGLGLGTAEATGPPSGSDKAMGGIESRDTRGEPATKDRPATRGCGD